MLLSIERCCISPLKDIHQAIISDKDSYIFDCIFEHHSYTFFMLGGLYEHIRKASRSAVT
jgi:hypothetical protein